jgi:hypothetical protein
LDGLGSSSGVPFGKCRLQRSLRALDLEVRILKGLCDFGAGPKWSVAAIGAEEMT